MSGAAPFTTPGGNSLSTILLTPQPITKDNLNVVLDAGWITKDEPLQGRRGRFGVGLRLTRPINRSLVRHRPSR